MRWLAALLVGGILVAGCGLGRSQADRDHDAGLIAAALRTLDDAGSNLSMKETLILTGGDIPAGQQTSIDASASGAVRAGAVRLAYKIKQQQGSADFDMLLGRGRLFVRPAGSQPWRVTAVEQLNALYPTLRLGLVRETVLLAKDVSGFFLTHVDQGFAHRYVITPAADQVLQFQSVPLDSGQEAAFLKTARLEVDIFLSAPGDRLYQIEVHMKATDPATKQTQKVDSTVSFKGGKVAAIGLPLTATSVGPQDILAPA